MADPTPFVPATESAPQTEAYAKKDPVLPSVEKYDPTSLESLSFRQPIEIEPKEEESFFDFNIFGDDEDDVDDEDPMGEKFILPKKQYELALRVAKESVSPTDNVLAAARLYSNKDIDDDVDKAESEGVIAESLDIGSKAAESVTDWIGDTFSTAVDVAGVGLGVLGDVAELPQDLYATYKLWELGTIADIAGLQTEDQTGKVLQNLAGDYVEAIGDAYQLTSSVSLSNLKSFFEGSAIGPEKELIAQRKNEEFDAAANELGKNIYSALTDKKLLAAAMENPGYVFSNRWNPTGEMFLDFMIPPDLARQLNNNMDENLLVGRALPAAVRPKTLAKASADPVGRMVPNVFSYR